MRGVATRPIQGRRLGVGKQNVPQHHDIPQYVMGSFPGPAVIFTEHVDGLEAWRRANAMKLGLGWSMEGELGLTKAARLAHDIKMVDISFIENRATHILLIHPHADNMKTSFTSLLSSVLLLAGAAAAAAPPKFPKAPGLTYLYQVNITGGEAAVVGKGPRGVRIVVPILFGSFEGPRLKGEISVRPMSRGNRC